MTNDIRNETKKDVSEKLKQLDLVRDENKVECYNRLSNNLKMNLDIIQKIAPYDFTVLNNIQNDWDVVDTIKKLEIGNAYFSLNDKLKKSESIKKSCLESSLDVLDVMGFYDINEKDFDNYMPFIKINKNVFTKTPLHMQNDIDFVIYALMNGNMGVWDLLSDEMKESLIQDKDIIDNLIDVDGFFYLTIKEFYPNDEKYIKSCLLEIYTESQLFKELSPKELDDLKNIDNIITEELKKDKEFIKDLVNNYVISPDKVLSYFPDDKEMSIFVIERFFSSSTYKYIYTSLLKEHLKKDKDVIHAYLKTSFFELKEIPQTELNTIDKLIGFLNVINETNNKVSLNDLLKLDVLKENIPFMVFLYKEILLTIDSSEKQSDNIKVDAETLLLKINEFEMRNDLKNNNSVNKGKTRKF